MIQRSMENLAQPAEPRLRVKISDVAWGVLIGLTAWSVLAFFGLIFLGVLGAAL